MRDCKREKSNKCWWARASKRMSRLTVRFSSFSARFPQLDARFLSLFSTHLTSTDSLTYSSCFESLRNRPLELSIIVYGCQPKAEFVGKVMARSPCSIALNERRCPEVTEARSGTRQGLPSTFGSGSRVHSKTVSYPIDTLPSIRTSRNVHILTVDSNNICLTFTDNTP